MGVDQCDRIPCASASGRIADSCQRGSVSRSVTITCCFNSAACPHGPISRRTGSPSIGSLKVAVIDGARQLGGLCILKGCMPSKTLLYAAEVLHHAKHAGRFGLKVAGAHADMKAVHARKK